MPREVLDIGSRLYPLWTRWAPRLRSSRQASSVRPSIARAARARALYSSCSRPTMKPSRPCGKSVSSASAVSGRVAGIAPWPPTSTVDCSNRASPSFGAPSARPSITSLFPVVVAGFVPPTSLPRRSLGEGGRQARRHLLRAARAQDSRGPEQQPLATKSSSKPDAQPPLTPTR